MRHVAAVLILIALNLTVFGQVLSFDFVNFDDNVYLLENARLEEGLSGDNVAWAFTTGYFSNWHPLTWLSFFLDYELFGIDAGGYHLTSALLHVLNSLLLYAFLVRMTAAFGPCLAVAALFAVHPLHVESVAWVSERKDVLSTFFWLVTALAYVAYVRRPTTARRLAVAIPFALGLMAKPMLVTLPAVLLLMDYWPLGRLGDAQGKIFRRWIPLLAEKTWLFVLAIASAVVTLAVQFQGGSVASLEKVALSERVSNALMAYVFYLVKTVWPGGLAIFYPLEDGGAGMVGAAGAAVFLLVLSIVAVAAVKRRPYLLIGWLWFLGMLVPVIGLIQVGGQSMADRYTYMPIIGLFIAAAWGLAEWAGDASARRQLLTGATVLAVLALTVAAFFQTRHWRNSEALFRHALAVNEDNHIAHNNLGLALSGRDPGEAERQYAAALEIKPEYVEAHINLGQYFLDRGRSEEAEAEFRGALAANPRSALAMINLGQTLIEQGRTVEALPLLSHALALEPDHVDAHYNFARALTALDRLDEAGRHFEAALGVMPRDPAIRCMYGNLLARQGRYDEAIGHYALALESDPGYALAHLNMGSALIMSGAAREARRYLSEALRLDPRLSVAEEMLEGLP